MTFYSNPGQHSPASSHIGYVLHHPTCMQAFAASTRAHVQIWQFLVDYMHFYSMCSTCLWPM